MKFREALRTANASSAKDTCRRGQGKAICGESSAIPVRQPKDFLSVPEPEQHDARAAGQARSAPGSAAELDSLSGESENARRTMKSDDESIQDVSAAYRQWNDLFVGSLRLALSTSTGSPEEEREARERLARGHELYLRERDAMWERIVASLEASRTRHGEAEP